MNRFPNTLFDLQTTVPKAHEGKKIEIDKTTISSNISIKKSDAIDFLKSIPSSEIDLIITDPAYSGMNQHLMLGRGRIIGVYKDKGENGKWFDEFHDTPENYDAFLKECKRILKPNRHIFVMFDSFSMLSLSSILRNYFNVKNIIVWDKMNMGMGHYFRRQCEFILFASKGKRALTRKNIPDIWRIKRIHKAYYPTQKPVEIFETMIASSKTENEKEFIVCDPFVGSGSSAIAALKQGCSFIGCDVSEKAIEISTNRVERFIRTGIDALQPYSCGETFSIRRK